MIIGEVTSQGLIQDFFIEVHSSVPNLRGLGACSPRKFLKCTTSASETLLVVSETKYTNEKLFFTFYDRYMY